MTRKKQRARSRQKRKKRWLYALSILAALLVGIGGAWLFTQQRNTGSTGSNIQLAPVSQLPANVRRAPLVVQEAYRFAIANPETLSKFPCYCGCGNMGHTSNRDCFILAFNPDGSIVFDDHALGCGLCVDNARDVMRLTRQGKSPVEIRTYIDREYSKFGPPTNTEPLE